MIQLCLYGVAVSKAVDELVNEVRVLYQSLVAIGNELHEGSGVSVGMRAVLEYLKKNGDHTVPQIARTRRVTRQRIQSLADRLMEAGLVTTRDNPASKRSPLLTLTDKGKKEIHRMRAREGEYLKQVDIPEEEIERARKVLARLRAAMEQSAV